MIYGRYSFHGKFNGEAHLPRFKGSTFRGTFGHSLKKISCALQLQQCGTCLLQDKCVYSQVFETIEANPKTQTPHPFVIEPSLDQKTAYHENDSFGFDIILFGWANDYLPYFIYAVQEMGRTGMGRSFKGKRTEFTLLQVSDDVDIVFSAETGKVLKSMPRELDIPKHTMGDTSDTFTITIHFVTPLRLKFQNKFNDQIPFHILVRAMLRRISSLNKAFGEGDPPLDYRGLVARSESVKTLSEDISWFDWRRYSNRQEQAMLMGGITGSITYEGRLSEFMPLIKYCEKVHIGKATTFGLGKILLQDH